MPVAETCRFAHHASCRPPLEESRALVSLCSGGRSLGRSSIRSTPLSKALPTGCASAAFLVISRHRCIRSSSRTERPRKSSLRLKVGQDPRRTYARQPLRKFAHSFPSMHLIARVHVMCGTPGGSSARWLRQGGGDRNQPGNPAGATRMDRDASAANLYSCRHRSNGAPWMRRWNA